MFLWNLWNLNCIFGAGDFKSIVSIKVFLLFFLNTQYKFYLKFNSERNSDAIIKLNIKRTIWFYFDALVISTTYRNHQCHFNFFNTEIVYRNISIFLSTVNLLYWKLYWNFNFQKKIPSKYLFSISIACKKTPFSKRLFAGNWIKLNKMQNFDSLFTCLFNINSWKWMTCSIYLCMCYNYVHWCLSDKYK